MATLDVFEEVFELYFMKQRNTLRLHILKKYGTCHCLQELPLFTKCF